MTVLQMIGPMIDNIGVAKAQSMLKVIPPLEPNAEGFGA